MEMSRYSEERKESVLRKLLPPANMSVAEISRQEGISTVTLYAWRNQVKAEGGSSARIGKGSRRMVCGGEVGRGD